MRKHDHSYTLRILRRDPYQETLDRMAEYFRVLSELLGKENNPLYAGIVKKSVSVRARIPDEHQDRVRNRIASNEDIFRDAERKLANLGVKAAELLDGDGTVCRSLSPQKESPVDEPRVYQTGAVDGVITGLVGADDTLHLYVHDIFGRKLTLVVKSVELAKDLLRHFRSSEVRLDVRGTWKRTDQGWVPEANKCSVMGYEVLDDRSISDIFSTLRSIPDNGWNTMDDPLEYWRQIRGIEH